jgi:hypothetical protein
MTAKQKALSQTGQRLLCCFLFVGFTRQRNQPMTVVQMV